MISLNHELKKKYLSTDDTDGCPQADGGQVLIKGEELVIKDSTSLLP